MIQYCPFLLCSKQDYLLLILICSSFVHQQENHQPTPHKAERDNVDINLEIIANYGITNTCSSDKRYASYNIHNESHITT